MGVLGLLVMMSFSGAVASPQLNCRLVVHVHHTSGKKRVQVEEIHSATREDCKLAAEERKLNEEQEDVARANVVFSFSDSSLR